MDGLQVREDLKHLKAKRKKLQDGGAKASAKAQVFDGLPKSASA